LIPPAAAAAKPGTTRLVDNLDISQFENYHKFAQWE
jgi:hypothetical protein